MVCCCSTMILLLPFTMLLLQGDVVPLDICSVVVVVADSVLLLLCSTAGAACMPLAQQAFSHRLSSQRPAKPNLRHVSDFIKRQAADACHSLSIVLKMTRTYAQTQLCHMQAKYLPGRAGLGRLLRPPPTVPACPCCKACLS